MHHIGTHYTHHIDPLSCHWPALVEVGRLMKEQMAKQSSFEVTPLQGLSFQDDGFQDSDDSGLDDIL